MKKKEPQNTCVETPAFACCMQKFVDVATCRQVQTYAHDFVHHMGVAFCICEFPIILLSHLKID